MPIDLLGMILFAGAMIGTPGPANMVVMASGARFGFRDSIPFLGGVILGKQFIIWPLGLGLLTVLDPNGVAFLALKWMSVAYILWLAWKIAGTRIIARDAGAQPPRFVAGLIVHPLNPKAWAMVLGSLTNFTDPAANALLVTACSAAVFLSLQVILQTIWTILGAEIAARLAGTSREVWLMRVLAALMVISVLYVLIRGG